MSVWGSTYQSNLSCVFILQKKIIRIISKVSFDSHTDVLFKEHGILKFFDIYFYQIGKLMYLFKKAERYITTIYRCSEVRCNDVLVNCASTIYRNEAIVYDESVFVYM